jgi:hypothetical protein
LGKFDIIIGLGVVGVGGYLFIKHLWPGLQREIESLGESLSGGGDGGGRDYEEEEEYERRAPPSPMMMRGYPPARGSRMFPPTIIEDRYPDIVYEDRFPDYPAPVVYRPPPRVKRPSPLPIDLDNPAGCPPGWRWSVSGEKCKRIECDSDEYWDGRGCVKLEDDIRDMESCPTGWRWSVSGGRCKKIECDSDEYWDGLGCHKIDCPSGYTWKDGTCRRRDESSSERRRRREAAEAISERIERQKKEPTMGTPELDRLEEIIEKASQNFTEVYYA